MLRHLPLLLLLLALVPQARAQTPDTTTAEPDLESVLEELTEDETGDPPQLLERLEDLREHPLDINAASANELALIPAFNLLLARRITQAVKEKTGLSVMWGIAAFPEEALTFDDMLKKARERLTDDQMFDPALRKQMTDTEITSV